MKERIKNTRIDKHTFDKDKKVLGYWEGVSSRFGERERYAIVSAVLIALRCTERNVYWFIKKRQDFLSAITLIIKRYPRILGYKTILWSNVICDTLDSLNKNLFNLIDLWNLLCFEQKMFCCSILIRQHNSISADMRILLFTLRFISIVILIFFQASSTPYLQTIPSIHWSTARDPQPTSPENSRSCLCGERFT